jgi:hypothetical protein
MAIKGDEQKAFSNGKYFKSNQVPEISVALYLHIVCARLGVDDEHSPLILILIE